MDLTEMPLLKKSTIMKTGNNGTFEAFILALKTYQTLLNLKEDLKLLISEGTEMHYHEHLEVYDTVLILNNVLKALEKTVFNETLWNKINWFDS